MKPRTGNLAARAVCLAFLAALGLAACSNDAAPPTTAPAQPQPQPTVSTRQPMELRFETDSPAIGSQVGKRALGLGISTTGKPGWLVFGPYIPLGAGAYVVTVVGFAQPDHSGSVYVDVASEKGQKIIATLEIDAATLLAGQSPDALVVLPFTLDSAVADLEVRVRVDENARLAVTEFQIRSAP